MRLFGVGHGDCSNLGGVFVRLYQRHLFGLGNA